jgi:hypothetical protein
MDEFGSYIPPDIDLRELLWFSDEVQKNRKDRQQRAKMGQQMQQKPRQRSK